MNNNESKLFMHIIKGPPGDTRNILKFYSLNPEFNMAILLQKPKDEYVVLTFAPHDIYEISIEQLKAIVNELEWNMKSKKELKNVNN